MVDKSKISIETKFLIQRLQKCEPGQLITFSEMSDVIGSEIMDHRNKLTSALSIVERDHGLVFQSVASVGYRLIEKSSIGVTAGERGVRKIRSTLKTWGKKLKTVNPEELSESEQKGYYASRDKYFFLSAATDTKVLSQVESSPAYKEDLSQAKEQMLRFLKAGIVG
jgi:hypothetical protein